ncbi:unnamed protein product [Effrenium voratum]|nr:unnamed protein product [Effrenium voratum]
MHHRVVRTRLAPGQCGSNPCPVAWAGGDQGGYFCEDTRGCRPAVQGPFPTCLKQCWIGNTPVKTFGKEPKTSTGGGTHIAPKPSKPSGPGSYDLRMVKQGKVVGCMAPISLIPGDPRYGCSGRYGTASTCDAATSPVKDTKYVAAVHRGCATEQGQGTYGPKPRRLGSLRAGSS